MDKPFWAVRLEFVARTIERVEHGHGLARAPKRLVGRRIVGAGDPYSGAAGLPSVGIAFPGFAAGLARRRDRELAPQQLSGRRVERRHVVAHAAVAARSAHDDLVLDR